MNRHILAKCQLLTNTNLVRFEFWFWFQTHELKWIWNHAKRTHPLLFMTGKPDKQAFIGAQITLWLPSLKLAEQSPCIPLGDGTKEVTCSWQCPSWDCPATQKLSFVWALLLLLLLSLQEKVSIQGSKEGGTGEPPAAFQWLGWSCTHTQQWRYSAHGLKKWEKKPPEISRNS